MGENPANHVFVDLDLKRQGNLLSDSRTAPVGITLLHFDYRTDEFCARTFRAGLTAEIRGERLLVAIPSMFGYNWLVHNLRVLTVELDNFAQELVSKMETEYLEDE